MADQKLSQLNEVSGGPAGTDYFYFIRGDGNSPETFVGYKAPIDDLPGGGDDLVDAPADGNVYGRMDEAWVEIPGVGGISPTEYTFDATTTAPPSSGTVRFNNASQAAVTTIWLHDINAVAVDVSNVVHLILPGNKLLVQDKATAANYQIYEVSGTVTDSGLYTTIPVTWESGGSDVTAGRCMVAAFGLGMASGSFTAASTTEVLTGTDSTKGATPDSLAALWEKGSDIASAGTITIGEGGYHHVTGTTGITDIDWATAKDGRTAWLVFDGVLTLTHNATTLKLPGGANITTAAGDRGLFAQDASDNVICLDYMRASGEPLSSAVVGSPFEMQVALSDQTTAITTGMTKADFFAEMNATITEVFIGIGTVSSSGAVTFDLNKAGSTMFSVEPSIVAGERTNLTGGGTAAVLGTTTWNKGDYMSVDFVAAGTGAKAAKIIIRGTRL